MQFCIIIIIIIIIYVEIHNAQFTITAKIFTTFLEL